MAQNITLMGAAYADVPAITVPKTGGGTARFDDASVTTAVESDVAAGKIFLLADGTIGTGANEGGSGYTRTVIAPQQTVTPDSNRQATLSGVTVGFVDASHYIVTLDGVEWYGTCETLWGNNLTVGEVRWFWDTTNDYVYPFGAIYVSSDGLTVAFADTNQHTIKVEKLELTVSGGGGDATLITKSITENGTYSASSDGADGYSQVTVNVPSEAGATMNTQIAQGVDRVNTTSYTAVSGQSITVEVTGTYDVYWTGFRSSTGGTNGSQLYIDNVAYGTAQTTFTNNGQSIKLTGVQLTAGQVVSVRARARGTNYYMYVGNLTIEQTA